MNPSFIVFGIEELWIYVDASGLVVGIDLCAEN